MTGRGLTRRRGRSGILPVGVALGVSAFLVVMLGFSPNLNPFTVLSGGGFRVRVPNLASMTQTRALVTVRAADLTPKVGFEHSTTMDRGLVVRQIPAEGDQSLRGGDVKILISSGPSQVSVPAVVGASQKDAAAALTAGSIGLKPVVSSRNDESVPKGIVISQTPAAEEIVVGGSSVILVVSLGAAPRPVPDVTKLPIEGAIYTLGREGFTLGNITNLTDPSLPLNAVVSTTPGKGEVRDKDTPIDLVISNGAADVSVPSVVGLGVDDASARLASVGLIASRVAGGDGSKPPGTVVSQSQRPNTLIKPGEVITLTVVGG